jgi:dethiobiotin synthetase
VLPGEPGDLSEVRRLSGVDDLHEFVRYGEPLAPATAARRLGEPGPDVEEMADRIAELGDRDLIIIEGAGGPLVHFNDQHQTFLDLVSEVDDLHRGRHSETSLTGRSVEVLLVASAGLGSLHAAAAASTAIRDCSLPTTHLVIGSWPRTPGLAERCNLTDLRIYGDAIIRGVIPEGAGRLDRPAFGQLAISSLTPTLGGSLRAQEFIRANAAPPPAVSARQRSESDR